jgi:hypothetical protein
MRSHILNWEQVPQRYFGGVQKQQPSLEELERDVVVLRNKLRSLELSHMRIEREAQRLTDQLEVLRNTISAKAPAPNRAYKAAV